MKRVIILLWILAGQCVLGQLAGNYFIDQNADATDWYVNGGRVFRSFTEAVDTLKIQGVSDSVRFEVAGGQVFYENIGFDAPVPGSAKNHPIRFVCSAEQKAVITPGQPGSNPLLGVIDFRHDGDYYITIDGLKIIARNGEVQFRRGVRMVWGPDHITIRNCEVSNFASEGIVIYWGGGSVWGNGCANNIIENNRVENAGLGSTSFDQVYGVWVSGGDSTVVRNNVVTRLLGGNLETAGIKSVGDADSNTVYIYNNMVSIGASITSDITIYGIFTRHISSSWVRVLNNSVLISGIAGGAENHSSAYGFVNTGETRCENNIGVNRRISVSGQPWHLAMYINGELFNYSGDYNDWYVTGPWLGYDSSLFPSLQAWRANRGQDSHSLSADPYFINTDDLHLRPYSSVKNSAEPEIEVDKDIDGQIRNMTYPEMGADEIGENRLPFFVSEPLLTVNEDALYSYSPQAADSDAYDSLHFELLQGPNFLTFDAQNEVLSGIPQNADTGWHAVTLAVVDFSNDSSFQQFDLYVQNVNDPPELQMIRGQTVVPGQLFTSIWLDSLVSDVDDSPDELHWQVVNGAFIGAQIDSSRRVHFFVTDSSRTGTDSLQFIVTDNGLLSDSGTVHLTIDAAPQISDSLLVLRFAEDDSLFLSRQTLLNYINDNEGADSLLNIFIDPGKTVQVSGRNEAWMFQAPANWSGVDTLLLHVSDGLSETTQSLFATVLPINDPPRINGLPDSIFFAADSSGHLSLDNYQSDIDSPDSSLHWTFQSNREWLRWHVNGADLTLTTAEEMGEAILFCTLTDDSLASAMDSLIVVVQAPLAVDFSGTAGLPKQFRLYQNYPNPFNPQTHLRYDLPEITNIHISVFNILGQLVFEKQANHQPAGRYNETWQAKDQSGRELPSGMYVYRLRAVPMAKGRQAFSAVGKMLLLR